MPPKGLDKAIQSAKHGRKTTERNFTSCTDHAVLHDVVTTDHN